MTQIQRNDRITVLFYHKILTPNRIDIVIQSAPHCPRKGKFFFAASDDLNANDLRHLEKCVECHVAFYGLPDGNAVTALWPAAFLREYTRFRFHKPSSSPNVLRWKSLSGETRMEYRAKFWNLKAQKVAEWLPEFGGDGRRTPLCSESAKAAIKPQT